MDEVHYARPMFREIRIGILAVCTMGVLLATGTLRAQEHAPVPIQILALTTDDADDQADALTEALRARVDAMSTWSLQQSTQSFETLSIALRCPKRPDSPCLQRIGDQIHTDHYLWGTMARARGDVIAQVNMWNRGEAGAQTSVTFQDNLLDPENPKLRAIAMHLLDTLLPPATAEPTPIVHGQALRSVGPMPAAQEAPAAQTTGTTSAAAAATPPTEPTVNNPPSRLPKVLGYAGIATGAVLLVAGGLETAKWVSDKSDADRQRSMVPANVSDVCAAPGYAAAATACQASTRETNDAVFAWVFTVAGVTLAGTGIWLLVATAGGEKSQVSRLPFEIVPTIGVNARSLDLRLRF
jgi:hypothetical protein